MCASQKAQTTRALPLSFSGGSAARTLATRARPATLVEVGQYPTEAHCASGTAVALCAWPCFDVRAAASKREAYSRMCASQKAQTARALSLSQEEAQHARLIVRAPRRTGWSRVVPYGNPLRQRNGRLPRCTAVLRRARRGLQTRSLLAHVRKSKSANRARSLSLSGRGAARALATCARRAALAALAPCAIEGHCLSEDPPSLLRKAVLPRASASFGHHLVRWVSRVARLHATALALSREKA